MRNGEAAMGKVETDRRHHGEAEIALADWERALRVSLTSVFLTCKHAAARMQASAETLAGIDITSTEVLRKWTLSAPLAPPRARQATSAG